MARYDYQDEQFVNSIIGYGSKFKGEVEIDGLIRIDGDFMGIIKSSGKIIVGSSGRADFTCNARIVVIGGIIRGNIYATEKVTLLSSALVLGNIYSPRLVVEEGVLMTGGLFVSNVHRASDPANDVYRSRPRYQANTPSFRAQNSNSDSAKSLKK